MALPLVSPRHEQRQGAFHDEEEQHGSQGSQHVPDLALVVTVPASGSVLSSVRIVFRGRRLRQGLGEKVQEGVARQRPDRERDQEVQHRAVEPLLHQRDDRDSAQAAEADDYDAEGCVEPDCKNKTRKKK